MSRLLLILALLLQPAPPDPQFLASWDGPGAATISWTQQQRGCLGVRHATGEWAFITCREGPGTQRVLLGHGPTDGTVRPALGDSYSAQIDGLYYRTPLRWRVYAAVFRG